MHKRCFGACAGACVGFSRHADNFHSFVVPNLFILGSQKAGTTDLFRRIVARSTDLATARPLNNEASYMDKELHFFEQVA